MVSDLTFHEWCSAALSASAVGEPLDVVDFGAVGDGVTDNTEAFSLALEVSNETRMDVIIPAGTFAVGRDGHRLQVKK